MKKVNLENLFNNITDNVVTDENELNKDDLIIETAALLNSNTPEFENNSIVTLTWLCKSKSEKLFTLCTNYITENELELENIKNMIFHNTKSFIGNNIATEMLLISIPSYVTEMDFDISYPIKSDLNDITLEAISVTKNEVGKKVLFHISAELFASLKFTDNYIMENIINHHNILLSTLSAAKVPETNTEFFIIDNIDRIISLAPIKNSTSIVVIFKATKYIDKESKETFNILVSFDIGVKYKKSKFKGNNVDKIESTYMTDSDQYISNFILSCRFKNLDKEYMCIKAKNKNNNSKLFLLDNNIKSQLEDLIKEY